MYVGGLLCLLALSLLGGLVYYARKSGRLSSELDTAKAEIKITKDRIKADVEAAKLSNSDLDKRLSKWMRDGE